MPRNVRNCWIEIETDGRSPVETGPRSATGGATITIKLREDGEISRRTIRIGIEPSRDGRKLDVNVLLPDGFVMTDGSAPLRSFDLTIPR